MDFDTQVKMTVYTLTAQRARVPGAPEVAAELRAERQEVEAAFERLYARRLLVLEPGDGSRLRMAPPFSGIETAFPVEVEGRVYYANCVWDALGVAAALKQDAVIRASDGHTGEPLPLEIRAGRPAPRPYVAHFAVPAARWWEDIIHT